MGGLSGSLVPAQGDANDFAATKIVKGGGTQVDIQAAIDALPANGGTIYLDGSFVVSSTITLPNKPVRFVGCGHTHYPLGSTMGATIDAGASVITVFTGSGYTTYPSFTFENISFVSDTAGVSGQNVIGVDGNCKVCFDRCGFSNFDYLVSTAATWTHFTSCRSVGNYGIYSGGSTDKLFIVNSEMAAAGPNGITGYPECHISNSRLLGTGADVQAGDDSCFSGCRLQGMELLLRDDSTVVGCSFSSTANLTVASTESWISIVGCSFYGTSNISMAGKYCRVIGVSFDWPGTAGTIVETTGAQYNVYTGNRLKVAPTYLTGYPKVDGRFLMNSDPDANSDITHGIQVGDHWFNTSTGREFVCEDNTDTAAVWSLVAGVPDREFQKVLSPSQITANQNNYNPGDALAYRISSDAARDITGVAPTGGNEDSDGNGRLIRFINVGSYAITFKHQDTNSTDVNRILASLETDIILEPEQTLVLDYDPTTNRWRDRYRRNPQYGGIYGYDENSEHTITNSGKANKVQVTAFDTNGASKGDVTPDHTNDHVTVGKAGDYRITATITIESVAAGTGSEYGVSIWKNNGATEIFELHNHRDLAGGGGDSGAIPFSAIVTLAANDTIEIWIWNEDNSDNVIVDDVSLYVERVDN